MDEAAFRVAQVERDELTSVDVNLLGRLETVLGTSRNELIDIASGATERS